MPFDFHSLDDDQFFGGNFTNNFTNSNAATNSTSLLWSSQFSVSHSFSDAVRMEFAFQTRSAGSQSTGMDSGEATFDERCTDDSYPIHTEFDKHKCKVDQSSERIQRLEHQLQHLKEQLSELVARVQNWTGPCRNEQKQYVDAQTQTSTPVQGLDFDARKPF